MKRAKNPVCSNGCFSCQICTGHGIVHSTIRKFAWPTEAVVICIVQMGMHK
jgi:hypothetical protein